MRILKVYLDTSVISHLFQEDVPEKMAETFRGAIPDRQSGW